MQSEPAPPRAPAHALDCRNRDNPRRPPEIVRAGVAARPPIWHIRAMTAPRPDRPMLGIALMLGFCVLAPMSDATAKLLSAVPLGMLVVLRFGMQTLLMAPFALGRRSRLSRRDLGLIALRQALHAGGIFCMFGALRFMPLAETVAIGFVMPFIMLLLGWAVLDERVGPRRIAACAVGFAGTLMVIQPTFAVVGLPALLPLAVALSFALFMLVTRMLRAVDPFVLQVTGGVMAVVVLVPVLLAGHAAGVGILALRWPVGAEWPLLILLGTLGTVAHLVMGWSLRHAPAATLAPMQYLEIPVATLIGWAVFGQLPNGLAAAGIGVTIAAGLYIILRERQIARDAAG